MGPCMRYLLPRKFHADKGDMLIQISLQHCWGTSNIPFISFIQSILIVTKEVRRFKKWTPCATDMRQLRSSHSSYDHAHPAVTINGLFPGVTVTINSPKFSHPDICNIRPCRCSFSHQKNQSVPWLSPCAIWTTDEVPCWHNPRKSVLTVFCVRHFDWS